MTLKWNDFELDTDCFELRQSGVGLAVQRKVLDLIVYLARHRDRVVRKEELLETVWKGITVTEASLSQAVSQARRVLVDSPNEQHTIRTVRGRGFRFVADVRDEPKSGRTAGRKAVIIGRQAELHTFNELLAARGTRGIFLHGPGGVGKTTLLREFVRRCALAGLAVEHLDGRWLPRTPGALMNALPRPPRSSTAEGSTEAVEQPLAVALDNLDHLGGLQDWLLEEWLSALSPNVLLILAGRVRPRPAAAGCLAATFGIRLLPVRNFDFEECRNYLASADVKAALHDPIYRLTTGHPLAAGLVADRAGQFSIGSEEGPRLAFSSLPEVVQYLVDEFLREVPASADYREALRLMALSRGLTEDCLRSVLELDEPRAAAVFDWLKRRSFVEIAPAGLVLHDLVREVFISDLRWRDHQRYLLRIRQLVCWFAEQIPSATPARASHLSRSLLDVIGLGPRWEELMAKEGYALPDPQPAEDADWREAEQLLARFEGPESISLLEYWRAQGATGLVVRDEQGLSGFTVELHIERISEAQAERDPIIAEVRRRMHGMNGTRPALIHRFWAARDTYQSVSPVHTRLALAYMVRALSTPRIALGAYVVRQAPYWDGLVSIGAVGRLCRGCSVGAHQYDVLWDDFRAGIADYMQRILPAALAEPGPPGAPAVVALPKPEIARWLERALDELHDVDRLSQNPLTFSQCIEARVGRVADARMRARTLSDLLSDRLHSLSGQKAGRSSAPPIDREVVQHLAQWFWEIDSGEGSATVPDRRAPEGVWARRPGGLLRN